MLRTVALTVFLAGCSEQPLEPPKATDTGERATTEPEDTAVDTLTETGTDFDCTAPLQQAPFEIVTHAIQTQEDFDFAASGHLVYQYGEAVVGSDKQGTTTVLSPGVAGDPRGVHGLSDGRIVVLSPWDGSIKIVDPATNGLDILAGGLSWPNGVEVDMSDRIYYTSEGEIGWTEPYGRQNNPIHAIHPGEGYPNGIALSPDEQRLTVAVPNQETTDFLTIERLGPDTWGNVQTLRTDPGWYSALDTDVCGNLYTVGYNTGVMRRIRTDGTVDELGVLPADEIWGFSAMRFGPGHGGWERDRLYITSRNTEIYEIWIGIPGRRHPTTP